MKDSLFNISLDNMSGAMMLTIEPKETMVINDFCCEMIKKTDVYGLLKLNVTTLNGSVKFNYDLSKKKSIAEYAKAGFNVSYGRRILFNLCTSFLKLNEYYLKPSYCLLRPEYTYIGDGLNVYLPYIPVKDVQTDPNELKQYFSELLSKYFAVEGIAAYDEMFKYVFQCQTLDLANFVSKFLASEQQSQENFAAEKQNAQANRMPLPNANQQQPQQAQSQPARNQNVQNIQQNQRPQMGNMQKPMANMQNKVPQGGFKMPGAGAVKMPGGGEMKIPGGGGFKMPGGNNEQKVPNAGGFKMPGGGGFKMPGFGNKPQAPQQQQNQFRQPVQPQQNQFRQPAQPQQNQFRQPMQQQPVQNRPMNMPNNGFQNNMDKTIMIDNGNPQMPVNNVSSGGSGAHLQYRGQNIPLNDPEFVIGKANNQFKINYAINDNPHVSRKHATILTQGSNYFIRDEGSTNGTFVNGRSLPKMVAQPLRNGDEISIYDEVFRFCL